MAIKLTRLFNFKYVFNCFLNYSLYSYYYYYYYYSITNNTHRYLHYIYKGKVFFLKSIIIIIIIDLEKKYINYIERRRRKYINIYIILR
jgi:hypothetical protein